MGNDVPQQYTPTQGMHAGQASYPLGSAGSHHGAPRAHTERSEQVGESSRRTMGDHCSFCLVAEFDIDRGSTLTHQYPAPLGHDEHMLAELMLPDGVHARTEDWTVFFLPRDTAPIHQDAHDASSSTSHSSSKGKGKAREDLTYVLSLVRTKHDTTVRRGALVKAIAIGTRHPFIHSFRPALLLAIDDYYRTPSIEVLERLYYCINSFDLSPVSALTFDEKVIMRTSDRRDLFEDKLLGAKTSPTYRDDASSGQRHDSQSYSGARGNQQIESDVFSFSHDDLPAPQPPFASQSQASEGGILGQTRSRLAQKASLASLRQNANGSATQAAGAQGSRRMPSGASNSTPVHFGGVPASRQPSATTFTSRDDSTVASHGEHRFDTHVYECSTSYSADARVDFRVPVDVFDQEIGEYSLMHLIHTFGNSTPSGPQHPHLHSNGNLTPAIILLFNAVATGKRVIFLGHNQPALQVASHVLSLCALGTGCGGAWEGVVGRCFPYANLGMLDELEQTPGFIAGVTNPRFEELRAWDVLCNIESGKITVAKHIEPAPPLRPSPDRPAGGHYASSSIGSASANDSEGRGQGRGVGDSEHSHAASTSSNARGQRIMPTSDARADAPDVAFMEELQVAIAARCGERHVRARFLDYALNFVRLAARHEEYYHGHTTLAPPSQPFLNGQLGSGLMFADRDIETRHITANAMRIEGWRATNSYRLLRDGVSKTLASTQALGFDLGHQVTRMRRAKILPSNECELMYIRIARSIKTTEQITELLALLPAHSGGLLPLSVGLFHPSSPVRNATLEILTRIAHHAAGQKMIQSLNMYHRLAFARSLHQRQEMLRRAHSASASVSGGSTGDTLQNGNSIASPRSGSGLPSKSPYVLAMSSGLPPPTSSVPSEFGSYAPPQSASSTVFEGGF